MKFGVQLFEASGQYSTLAPDVCSQSRISTEKITDLAGQS